MKSQYSRSRRPTQKCSARSKFNLGSQSGCVCVCVNTSPNREGGSSFQSQNKPLSTHGLGLIGHTAGIPQRGGGAVSAKRTRMPRWRLLPFHTHLPRFHTPRLVWAWHRSPGIPTQHHQHHGRPPNLWFTHSVLHGGCLPAPITHTRPRTVGHRYAQHHTCCLLRYPSLYQSLQPPRWAPCRRRCFPRCRGAWQPSRWCCWATGARPARRRWGRGGGVQKGGWGQGVNSDRLCNNPKRKQSRCWGQGGSRAGGHERQQQELPREDLMDLRQNLSRVV